jgi:hypothetical protein
MGWRGGVRKYGRFVGGEVRNGGEEREERGVEGRGLGFVVEGARVFIFKGERK